MKKNVCAILLTLFFFCESRCVVQDGLSRIQSGDPLAGSWYPADPSALIERLKVLSDKAREQYSVAIDYGAIRACIVPHAGLAYSGVVAASVYRLLGQHSYDRVILLVPSHYTPLHGVLIPKNGVLVTPIGELTIDADALFKVQSHHLFHTAEDAFFAQEHALGMQLPWLCTYVPHVPVLPMLVGRLTAQEMKSIAARLKTVITDRTVIIVSSDITHYGDRYGYAPYGVSMDGLHRAMRDDGVFLMGVQKSDMHAFLHVSQERKSTSCGYYAIGVLMYLCKKNGAGSLRGRCISYETSCAAGGLFQEGGLKEQRCIDEIGSFVTYAGIVYTNPTRMSDRPTRFEERILLGYARRSITDMVLKKTGCVDLVVPGVMTPWFDRSQGVFVTIYQKKDSGERELRGCVGVIRSTLPLIEQICLTAREAAFHDSRFLPVGEQDLSALSIEISLLGPPRPVVDVHDIVLHRDGIIMHAHGRSALFLPQVPKEFGWTLEETLAHLSQKAGLSSDVWREKDTAFEVFEAHICADD